MFMIFMPTFTYEFYEAYSNQPNAIQIFLLITDSCVRCMYDHETCVFRMCTVPVWGYF